MAVSISWFTFNMEIEWSLTKPLCYWLFVVLSYGTISHGRSLLWLEDSGTYKRMDESSNEGNTSIHLFYDVLAYFLWAVTCDLRPVTYDLWPAKETCRQITVQVNFVNKNHCGQKFALSLVLLKVWAEFHRKTRMDIKEWESLSE